MTTNQEIKNKYLPSKEFIDSVTKNLKENNEEYTQKYGWTYTEQDAMRIAIERKWDKVLTKKEQSMFFKDIADEIIKHINEVCNVTDMKRGNGYYIFEFGDNSVVHLRIKELPGWLFGMWFSYDKKMKGVIKCEWFCQQDLWLNKFKPCCSEIQCTTSFCISQFAIDKILTEPENVFFDGYQIIDNIKFMIKHPWLAAYRDYRDVSLNTDYVTEKYAKKYMKKAIKERNKYISMVEKLEEKVKNKVMQKVKQHKFVETVKVIDRNQGGCICHPRYLLQIDATPGFSDEHYQKLHDDIAETISEIQEKLSNQWKYKTYLAFDIVDDNVEIFVNEEETNERNID